jgi:hypothetical protein
MATPIVGLLLVPILAGCNASPSNGVHLTLTGPMRLTDSGRFTDTTIVKSGPFASNYEVRGRRRGYFFPPNTLITTTGSHLLVRSYGQIFVFRLSDTRVRRMSSLVWIDPRHFPTERNQAVLRAYRKSTTTRSPRGPIAGPAMDCDDCVIVPDPMPPTGPPFPVPPRPPIPLLVPH